MTNLADKSVIDKYNIILLDCDGVLWRGPHAIPGAKEFIDNLIEKKKTFFFVSNSSMTSREGLIERAKKCGLSKELKSEQALPMSYIVAQVIKRYFDSLPNPIEYKLNYNDSISFNVPADASLKNSMAYSSVESPCPPTVYLICSGAGVTDELDKMGINWIGADYDKLNRLEPAANELSDEYSCSGTRIHPSIKAVICGCDFNISYYKIAYAAQALQNDCLFYSTTPDKTGKLENGSIFPAGGALQSAIEAASGKKGHVVGKPNAQYILEFLKETLSKQGKEFDCKEVLMIGDNLETDITFAKNAGFSW